MPDESMQGMKEEPEVKHVFKGTPGYRAFLLVVTSAMAVLIVLVGTVISADANWARQLCALAGALSAILFAAMVGTDIFRPDAITPARLKVAARVLLALPVIAIALAVVGFFA